MTIFRHAAKTAFLAATALFVVAGCSSGLDRLAPIAAAPPGPQALETGDSDTAEAVLRDHVAAQGGKFNDLMASYKQSNLRANSQPMAMRG